MVPSNIPEKFQKDRFSIEILNFIKSRGNTGSHLNELTRELSIGSRVTILDRLTNLEDAGVLESQMEFSKYGEEHVQKWVRKYRISKRYEHI